jgi:hypothetical protein
VCDSYLQPSTPFAGWLRSPRTNKRTEIHINIYSSTVIQQREREYICFWFDIMASKSVIHRNLALQTPWRLSTYFSFSFFKDVLPPFIFVCTYYTLCVSFAFICHDWPIDPTSLYYYTTDHLSLTLSSIRLLAIDPTLADICTTTTQVSNSYVQCVFFGWLLGSAVEENRSGCQIDPAGLLLLLLLLCIDV